MNSPVGCIFKPDNEKGGKYNVKTDNEQEGCNYKTENKYVGCNYIINYEQKGCNFNVENE